MFKGSAKNKATAPTPVENPVADSENSDESAVETQAETELAPEVSSPENHLTTLSKPGRGGSIVTERNRSVETIDDDGDVVPAESIHSLVFEAPVQIDKTPAEFMHLFASLERQVARATEEHLRTNGILGSQVPYVLGVTSALVGEGETTVALHLAMSAARSTAKKICLIDFSLGNDEVCRRMGLGVQGEGIMDVVEGKSQTITTLKLTGGNDLVVIPAGRVPDNPARAARSPRVTEIMAAVRQNFDVIVLDLPAVSTDHAVALSNHADGLLMIAWSGVTPKRVLHKAIEDLGKKKIIGIVLNRFRPALPNWIQRRFR